MSEAVAPPGTVATPVLPSRTGPLRPIPLTSTALEGGFWGEHQGRNATVTLHHVHSWLEREGWLDNFDLAAQDRLPEGRRGREFSDSEVYKWIEAAAWELGRSGDAPRDDAGLQEKFDDVVERVAAAQEPDGYLNTRFGHQRPEVRYTDFAWGHELYCYGHLFQAAVARLRTTGDGDDPLVAVARRAADHVCATFGADEREDIGGHPEIELGLVELSRATGDSRYLDQAALFIDRRGHGLLPDPEFGRAYYQDDVPVRQADTLRGHAVRATYLAAAAVDLAVETGDRELLDAVVRQWEHTVATRTYLTGAMGSHHQDEAYGDDFELPPDRAYAETCAGIGFIYLSWRLLLATGDARYADFIERTMFNVLAASPGVEGDCFFYTNPLQQRVPGEPTDPETVSPRARASLRAPWFSVSCCPTNVSRTFASLNGYFATTSDTGVQIHQYAGGTIAATFADRVARLRVDTDYPWDGTVRVTVDATDDEPWTLSLRVPHWAAKARISTPDRNWSPGTGTVEVERAWRVGDEVVLELPVSARWTQADPRVDAVRGCVAVERGPLVYCSESVDQPGVPLDRVVVDTSAPLEETSVSGLPASTIGVRAAAISTDAEQRPWPYAPLADGFPERDRTSTSLTLVPYHLWANRGPATMRVWIPAASRHW